MPVDGDRSAPEGGFATRDRDCRERTPGARALRAGEPTAWFEELYAAGQRRRIDMPWDRDEPLPLFRDWLQTKGRAPTGLR